MVKIRDQLTPGDVAGIREITQSSGNFSPEEVSVAIELAEERLRRGRSSGYHFFLAELGSEVVGFSCFGPIPATAASFDLYWIAVLERLRGGGIGKKLLRETEEQIVRMGGRRIYIETSTREQYRPTRSFYQHFGYREIAVLEDFYAPGDSKAIFLKVIDVHDDAHRQRLTARS